MFDEEPGLASESHLPAHYCRAGIQLEHIRRETGRHVHLATLASSMNDIHTAFDAVLNLRPHEFGREMVALLQDVIADPPDEVIARIHTAEIISSPGVAATDY